jgi:hypothetical protein
MVPYSYYLHNQSAYGRVFTEVQPRRTAMRPRQYVQSLQFLMLACICETHRQTGSGPTDHRLFIDLGNVYNIQPDAIEFIGTLDRLTWLHVTKNPYTARYTPTPSGSLLFAQIAPYLIAPCPTISATQLLQIHTKSKQSQPRS